MSIVVLVSGGIDSTLMSVMVKEQGIEQFPLYINYGQLCYDQEWAACKALHRNHELPMPLKMNLSGFGKVIESGLTRKTKDVKKDAFLPGRNLLFLLAGSSYAFQKGASAVAIGLLNEDKSIFPDQTSTFLENAQKTIYMSYGKEIKILAPLMMFNKGDVINLSKQHGICGTYSCHSGGEKPCGKCISCLEILNSKKTKGD